MEAFTEPYRSWCRRKNYKFRTDTAHKMLNCARQWTMIFCSDSWHLLAGLCPLWSPSECFQNLKINFEARPSVFKFNLKLVVIFLQKFLNLQTAAFRVSWYPDLLTDAENKEQVQKYIKRAIAYPQTVKARLDNSGASWYGCIPLLYFAVYESLSYRKGRISKIILWNFKNCIPKQPCGFLLV